METNPNLVSREIVAAAMKVHTALGPGLLESVYETCLEYELKQRGLAVERQVAVPIRYGEMKIDGGLRLDLLVNGCVIVELKTVEALSPIHTAQLLSYLRLSDKRLGLLLNFKVVHLREGIKRVVNGLNASSVPARSFQRTRSDPDMLP
jgi:GxxExxY protein